MRAVRLFWAVFILLAFLSPDARGDDTPEDMFARYFSEKIKAESILAVVNASQEDLARGSVPSLTVCIERAPVGGAVYDRLLLTLSGVLFTRAGREVKLHSYSGAKLSGTILKKDFLKTLEKNMPRYSVTSLELKDGRVNMLGAYRRKATVKMHALIRLSGQYVIAAGAGTLKFDSSTNDNPFVSAADVGRAVARAAPALNFSDFFTSPKVEEVRVDHDMVWFSAKQ